MPKGLSLQLNAKVLHASPAMGRGDDLIIADTNFPSDSVARRTALDRLLRIDGMVATEVTAAVLSLMPLDSFASTEGAIPPAA